MQIFIINSGLTNPISSLSLQKVSEDIAKGLVADNLLNQVIIVLLTLKQSIVCANGLPDHLPLKYIHFL
jgi:hypothetical protein